MAYYESIDRRDLIPGGLEQIQRTFGPEQLPYVLEAAGHCPGIWQIAVDNPCLAYMLACHDCFVPGIGSKRWDAVRKRLGYRRKDILEWLGWPGTEWCVRMISRINMADVGIEDLSVLREVCEKDLVATALRHLPGITAEVIRIVSDEKLFSMVYYSFLEGIVVLEDDRPFSKVLTEAARLSVLHDFPLHVFAEAGDLALAFDLLLSLEFPIVWNPIYDGIVMPEPAISIPRYSQPKGIHLEAFRDALDLYKWAHNEHNCAFSMIEEVLAGERQLFKVLEPVRGTLSLVRRPDGAWHLDQLLSARNKQVSREALLDVAGYLSRRLDKMENTSR